MSYKEEREGEIRKNNVGSTMIVKEYITNRNITVYFPDYDWTREHCSYDNFIRGRIKCPYEPRFSGKGYMGEGKYNSITNNIINKAYESWVRMLSRCYSEKYHKLRPSYKDCIVCDEWLNFQNFAQWYENNYYEILGETMHLDKDILVKNNKIYSPETCIIVPQRINSLFVKSNSIRGNLPIGVHYDKKDDRYSAWCRNGAENRISKCLGCYYKTPEEAFEVYKDYKEKLIKTIADQYKDKIPENIYNAMYNYKVDIDD